MIVVSDTSPIRALQAISRLDVLRSIYQVVIVPPAVASELAQNVPAVGPLLVSDFPFITVRAPSDVDRVGELRRTLDKGEAEAVALALEIHADTLLIDEARGRRVAKSLGLNTVGVLSVLVHAKRAGLVERVAPLLVVMETRIRFRIAPELKAVILADAGE